MLLRKIEELTLHLIEVNKTQTQYAEKQAQFDKQQAQLESRIRDLEAENAALRK
jgi:hypothetical protein